MTLAYWDERILIGIEEIDREHKQLIQLFSDFRDAVLTGRGPEALGGTVDRIIAYTAYHFRHEEELFSGTDYPEAEAHKAEHVVLTRRIMDIQGKLRFGASENLVCELDLFMREWLANHVLVVDKGMAPYLTPRG